MKPGFEFLGLGRIRGGEADNEIGGVRDPDPVLLVDGEVERPEERFAWLGAVTLAEDPAFGPVTLGEMQELTLRDAQSPYVAAGVAMMPCIKPSLPLKVTPSGGVSGLPFLSNTAIDIPP